MKIKKYKDILINEHKFKQCEICKYCKFHKYRYFNDVIECLKYDKNYFVSVEYDDYYDRLKNKYKCNVVYPSISKISYFKTLKLIANIVVIVESMLKKLKRR